MPPPRDCYESSTTTERSRDFMVSLVAVLRFTFGSFRIDLYGVSRGGFFFDWDSSDFPFSEMIDPLTK